MALQSGRWPGSGTPSSRPKLGLGSAEFEKHYLSVSFCLTSFNSLLQTLVLIRNAFSKNLVSFILMGKIAMPEISTQDPI